MAGSRIIAIIPARYHSSRFPGKPLAKILGKPMIYHVYKQCKKSKLVDEVIVATDDFRIANVVKKFGGKVVLTSSKHTSGTDRIAEVTQSVDAEIVVNVQGDEPLIHPSTINATIKPLVEDPKLKMTTAKFELRNEDDYNNPNITKIVVDKKGFALYCSRSLIPYPKKKPAGVYKQLGIYAYRRSFLLQFTKMKPSTLEKTESLEQLRAIENDIKLKTVDSPYDSIGVDIPEDIKKVENIMRNQNERQG